jgi:hypothetical protein
MTRFNVSESTLHRYRRQGFEAIARVLQQGELGAGAAHRFRTPNAAAFS